MFYGMLLLIGLTGAVGDIWLYRWAQSNRPLWFVSGLASWLISLILFALLMRSKPRSLSVTFVLIAVVHTAVVLGWDHFSEGTQLSRNEIAGALLAIAGVLLIEFH